MILLFIGLLYSAVIAYVLVLYYRQRKISLLKQQSLVDYAGEIETQKRLLTNAISASRNETWYWNESTNEFSCSATFWKVFGYQKVEDFPESEMTTFCSHIDPDEKGLIEGAIEQAQKSDKHFEIRVESRNRLGENRWIRVEGEITSTGKDQTPCILGTIEDIHEYKLAKLKLVQNESFLSNVGSLAKVGGWSFEIDTKTFYWSEQTRQIHDVAQDYQPTLDNAFIYYSPESQPVVLVAFEKALESGDPWDLKLPLITAKGRKIWVRSQGEIRDQLGQIKGYLGIAFDITNRKAIESQLERLATAVSKSTNGMVITDPQGQIEWVNDGFSRICGYQLAELTGKSPGAVLQGEKTDPIVVDHMKKKMREGEGFEAELIYYHKSGSEYWIRIKADPIYDRTGKITGFIAIENDVTDQKRAELDLVESREKVHQLLDALPTVAYTCDKNGLITYFNQAAVDFWGQKPKLNSPENRYCGSCELFDQDGTPISHDDSWMAIAINNSQVVYGKEMIIECADGERKTVLAHANPILGSSGEINGAINVLVDISDRIKLEKSLKETTARLEICLRVLDQHAIVAETDLNGTIRHVNDMFCKVSGYSREETIGQTHRIVNSAYHSREFWKNVFKTIADKGMWQGTICNSRKNGENYWVDTTIAAMLDGDGKSTGYLAIRNDITELIVAQEAALSASHSKSEFLANMSHEIRTPLTAILGYADLLQDDSETANVPEKRSEAIRTIQDAGNHLLTVINDILDLSKIEAGRLELEETVTHVFNVLDHVETLLKPPAIEKGVNLNTQIETPIPDVILSDPTRLRQILMNLVGNAVKFTERGRICILVKKTHLADREFLQFEIEDSGPGMSQHQADKMFKAFSQADTSVTRQHGGTGLGLVISRKLARMMDGEVSLAWTEQGKGTCFQFVLPIKTLSQTRNCTSRNENELDGRKQRVLDVVNDQTLSGTRILLAEDGPDNQKLISFILAKAGAIVEIANNGSIAYQKYHAAKKAMEPFDILLTDMQMPEMDGYSLAQKLRSEYETLPIIALTAHAMAEDRQKCLDAGCDDYLSKPVNRKALTQTVFQWKKQTLEKQHQIEDQSDLSGKVHLN